MLKLSGEALKGKNESGYDGDFMDELAAKIKWLVDRGIQVTVLLGWGNLYRWVQGTKHGISRRMGDHIGMVATIMNGLAVQDFLVKHGLTTKVMSAIDIPRIADFFVMNKAIHHLNQWTVVICVGGTGNPFFTTDTGAVQRALELDCDFMIKATKVDGVYDKDPVKHPDAIKFDHITLKDALDKWLNVMDHAALAMAMDNKLPILVCHINDIEQIGTDELVATYVTNE